MYQFDIKMAGYDMEPQRMTVVMSRHARERVLERHDSESPDTALIRIALLLERKDIADYVLNEVRIGDCAVILDEDSNCAYSIATGEDAIYIKTVYYLHQRHFIPKANDFFILLKDAEIQIASVFSDVHSLMAAF